MKGHSPAQEWGADSEPRADTCSGDPVRLSILLVNYNGLEFLGPCLDSIHRFAGREAQVVLADNASTDGSVEALEENYPWVQILRSDRNLGFSAGNNLAGTSARGKFILLLNTDTLLMEPVAPLVDWLENHEAYGALTINMLDGNYISTACTGRFPSPLRLVLLRSMLISPAEYGDKEAYDADWLQGSFLLIRSDLWRKLNGFDERYFMYAEDVDLCKRILESGFRCAYLPHSEYLHFGGFTPSRFPDQICSLATYVECHMTGLSRLFSWGVLCGGCLVRAAFYALKSLVKRHGIDQTKARSSWRAFAALVQRLA